MDGADLVVAGGGLAGMYAALCAASEADVVLVTGGPLLTSASALAQGGVAAAVGEGDSPALHAADTAAAGRGLSRPSAVDALTDEAPARVRDLVDLGVRFDPELGLEGGHGRRRVLHVDGAATGARICAVLARRVLAHARIAVREHEPVVGLWKAGDRCVGVRTARGGVTGRATLLATGGYSSLWQRTTNPAGSGRGLELAFRAGAALADLELVQFHPTVLATNGLLLSEALRGEGATLRDARGRRFTDELAPRDVVARAIAARGTALLDLREIDRDRFPALMATLAVEGFDPAQRPVPVSPAAHYTMGGIRTDLHGRTDVESLYAAGECACTGVHGANRLASNSLLECLVFARRAALASLDEPAPPSRLPPPADIEPGVAVTPRLRRALWEHAGLIRDADGLGRLRGSPHLLVRLLAECALLREESRGAHFRADHPVEDGRFLGHTVVRPGRPPELETWR